MQTVSDIFPAGGLKWRTVSSDTSVTRGMGYMVDTSGGAVTLTLPPVPTEGYQIGILDASAGFSTNSLTIARNGQNIMGIAKDMVLASNYKSLTLVFSDSTNGWRISSTTPCQVGDSLSPRAAQKNLLINGDMAVNQRGVGATDPISSTGTFLVDRFLSVYNGASGVTSALYTNLKGSFPYRLAGTECTSFTKTGNNFIYPVRHKIEGSDVDFLTQGGDVVLSFDTMSSVAGIHTMRLIVRNTVDGDKVMIKEFTIDAVDTPQRIVIPFTIPAGYLGDEGTEEALDIIFGTTTGPDRYGTPNVWGTDVSLSSTVNAVDWANGGNKRFRVGRVQLELGDTATDFEYRSYGEELALCQRYYQPFNAYRSGTVTQGSSGIETSTFVMEMRTPPTVSNITLAALLNCTNVVLGSASSTLGLTHYPEGGVSASPFRYQVQASLEAEL